MDIFTEAAQQLLKCRLWRLIDPIRLDELFRFAI